MSASVIEVPRPVLGTDTELTLREAVPADIPVAGRILFDAFASLADRHGFPRDFGSVEVATGCIRGLITNPGFHGVVAERDGTLVGSTFLDERSMISAIGPVSVDPAAQDGRIGRALMEAMLRRAADRGAAGVRLIQISYHNRSLCLYAKLGFDVQETFAAMYGETPGWAPAVGTTVRPATGDDEAAANALCVRVHGFERGVEVRHAIDKGRAQVVVRDGRITGYTTGINYFSHSVAETTDDLQALICANDAVDPPGIIVPLSDPGLFRWALTQGLRVFFVMNLMSMGIYQQPRGAYLPSIGY